MGRVHGRGPFGSERGADEGKAGVVGFGGDVHEPDLEAAEDCKAVDKADLEAVKGSGKVEHSDLGSLEVVGMVEIQKTDLDAPRRFRQVDKTGLDAAEVVTKIDASDLDAANLATGKESHLEPAHLFEDIAQSADMDAVDAFGPVEQGNLDAVERRFRRGEKVHAETGKVVHGRDEPDIEASSLFVEGTGQVEAEAVDGCAGIDELGVDAISDLQRRKRGGESGGGAERRSE